MQKKRKNSFQHISTYIRNGAVVVFDYVKKTKEWMKTIVRTTVKLPTI